MCANAVGTGGGPEGEGVNGGNDDARRDDDGAGATELAGGSELAAAADDDVAGGGEVTGTLAGELTEAVGAAACDDDVHALTHRTAPTPSAATQRVGRVTKAGCRGRPRRIRSVIRRHWPWGTRSACPFRQPSR